MRNGRTEAAEPEGRGPDREARERKRKWSEDKMAAKVVVPLPPPGSALGSRQPSGAVDDPLGPSAPVFIYPRYAESVFWARAAPGGRGEGFGPPPPRRALLMQPSGGTQIWDWREWLGRRGAGGESQAGFRTRRSLGQRAIGGLRRGRWAGSDRVSGPLAK